jgi:anhydro-N-acetylmuramic acid kinase
MPQRLIIGAMSGTSADGVDAALVGVRGIGLEMTAQLICHCQHPYMPELRKNIFDIRGSGKTDLSSLARIGRDITLSYALAVKQVLASAKVPASDVAAIAAHGQTLFHEPPLTIQWFDPSLLAWETNCAVISDFRRADCAAGGQGAPLVPFADYILFRHPTKNRILLNIGGIANLTYIPTGGAVEQLVAFDTGPGNCISDWICRMRGPFGLSWDVDGVGASRGRVVLDIANKFLAHPFFGCKPPRSTDGPVMIAAFENAMGQANVEMNDLLATAAYVTASSIAGAINSLSQDPRPAQDLIASGGGMYNKAIMGWLRSMLVATTSLHSTTDLAIPSDAKEAIAFALLGAATLDGVPSNVPSVTGARRGIVLGSITPRP